MGGCHGAPVSLAARAALLVACDVATDFMAVRATLIPDHFVRQLAARRMAIVHPHFGNVPIKVYAINVRTDNKEQ